MEKKWIIQNELWTQQWQPRDWSFFQVFEDETKYKLKFRLRQVIVKIPLTDIAETNQKMVIKKRKIEQNNCKKTPNKQTNKQTKTKQKQTYFQKLFFASFFSVKTPRIFLLLKKVKFQSFMNNHASIYHHIITQVYKIKVESWSTSAFFLSIFSYWVQKWHPFLVYTAVFFANLKKIFFSKITFSLENYTCGINFL